jgi:hypothetical protein
MAEHGWHLVRARLVAERLPELVKRIAAAGQNRLGLLYGSSPQTPPSSAKTDCQKLSTSSAPRSVTAPCFSIDWSTMSSQVTSNDFRDYGADRYGQSPGLCRHGVIEPSSS